MIAAGRLLNDNWNSAAATFRATFGVSLMNVGTPRLRWREAYALTVTALGDPSTYLAAEVGGMKYPASEVQTLQASALLAIAGVKEHESAKALPFGRRKKADAKKAVSDVEFAEATRRMLAGLGIPEAEAEKSIGAALGKRKR